MSKYLVQRLWQIVLIAFVASIVVFSLLQLAPGDPVLALRAPGMSAEDIAKLYDKYGLDEPLPVQYTRWLMLVMKGDLGNSILTNKPVNEIILRRFTNTLKLTLVAMSIATTLGVVGGVLAATRRGSLMDVASMSVAILGFSVPPFWLGLLLILVFSVKLGWLPAGGVGTWKHLVLPAVSLGTAAAAVTARMTRSSMLEVLNMNYIMSARAKGLEEQRVLFLHALKNALIPVLTILGQMTGTMLAGAVVTETVFVYPGIGYTLVQSLAQRDYPIIQAALLLTSLSYLVMNLFIDIAYTYLDPRIRFD